MIRNMQNIATLRVSMLMNVSKTFFTQFYETFYDKRYRHLHRTKVLSFDTSFIRRQISDKDSFAKLTSAKLSLWLPSHRVRMKIEEKCENDEERISEDDTTDRVPQWPSHAQGVGLRNDWRLRCPMNTVYTGHRKQRISVVSVSFVNSSNK